MALPIQKKIAWGLFTTVWLLTVVAWAFHIRQKSVDLWTGKERHRRLLFGLCVHERIVDTAFSRLLDDHQSRTPIWRVSAEMGPFDRFSAHFTHHSTPTLLQETVLIGDFLDAPADERRQIAVQVTERLRKNDVYGAQRLVHHWQESGEIDPD